MKSQEEEDEGTERCQFRRGGELWEEDKEYRKGTRKKKCCLDVLEKGDVICTKKKERKNGTK